MTTDQVAAVYEEAREKAIRILRERNIPRDVAEDAVQDAVRYFIERAESYTRLTPSLFIQKTIGCAIDAVRASGTRRFEVATGTTADLADVLARGEDYGAPPPARLDIRAVRRVA